MRKSEEIFKDIYMLIEPEKAEDVIKLVLELLKNENSKAMEISDKTMMELLVK